MTGKCIAQIIESPCRLPHYSLKNTATIEAFDIGARGREARCNTIDDVNSAPTFARGAVCSI